ncbi:MAG: riboflavin synthase [bacterium]
MFTGIIETTGTVRRVSGGGDSFSLAVEIPSPSKEIKAGDSVAVDGVCLTATGVSGSVVEMDVGEETYRRTTLKRLRPGARVNIETSLTAEKALGGHFVTGHVDAEGTVAAVSARRTQREMRISHPPELAPFIVEKGSVAVDGISLTVGETGDGWFAVYLIPHSWENTTLSGKRAGAAVNLEVDIIARYVWKVLGTISGGGKEGGIMELLEKYGYTGGGSK